MRVGLAQLLVDAVAVKIPQQRRAERLLDARDLNEAIQMAAKIPPAREGSVEVRPVRELEV